jgi:hypothetical protein
MPPLEVKPRTQMREANAELPSSNSCNGDSSSDIYAPGAKELGGMNDKTTSFKCYKN